jgi:hypothetical protein
MNSRAKGKAGELEAAHYLADLFRLPVRRGQQFRGGPDSPDVIGLRGLHVEVKRAKKLNLDAALEQSAGETATDEVPILLHRSNRKRWKLTIYADDLLRFLDAAGTLIDEGHRAARMEGGKVNDRSATDVRPASAGPGGQEGANNNQQQKGKTPCP